MKARTDRTEDSEKPTMTTARAGRSRAASGTRAGRSNTASGTRAGRSNTASGTRAGRSKTASGNRTGRPREPHGRPAGPRTAPAARPVERTARPKDTAAAKARATARKAKAPKLIRLSLRERMILRLEGVDLRPRALLARIPFVMLVIGALALGLGITLWLSTASAQRSYQLGSARTLNDALTQQKEALERDVLQARSAPALADAARNLGMIPSSDTAHLIQDPIGNWVVVGEPKPAQGAPPPPLNTKLPDLAPSAPPKPAPPTPAPPMPAPPMPAAVAPKPGAFAEVPSRTTPLPTPGTVHAGAGAVGPSVPNAPPAPGAPTSDTLTIGPAAPVGPLAPTVPAVPNGTPGTPGTPGTAGPAVPIGPAVQVGPIGPAVQVGPIGPAVPVWPVGPVGPVGPTQLAAGPVP